MEKYTLIYSRWSEGRMALDITERFPTKESAYLALARDILDLAEKSSRDDPDQIKLWVDAPSGRRLTRVELDVGTLAKAFEKKPR